MSVFRRPIGCAKPGWNLVTSKRLTSKANISGFRQEEHMSMSDTADELSMRAMLDTTMRDFGVERTPLHDATAEPIEPPARDISNAPLDSRTQLAIAFFALAIVALAFVLWGMFGAAQTSPEAPQQAETARPAQTITAAPTAAPTAAAERLMGYFDYRDADTVTMVEPSQIGRIVGTAGCCWLLVTVGGARVWIPTAELPSGIVADDPLPDLAPRPTSPAATVAPATSPALAVPAAAPLLAPPAQCLTLADIRYTTERDVIKDGVPIGHVIGRSC